ncbi:phosphatidylinositol 3,4,5-trisphosphate 3-phosphatase and protein-tyrosine-phosphatase PTEN2A-like [Magnolia sinica]|uniref:phosphatidylinositol 3,4,5-trisphosphate 3-phosphatase and protein-tyrosine-phosphatase PTEN2A-like n=1 Tax=Magnolia sinica TaxID=86752 RepID=UPI00265A7AAF|nr:phosphatidylinositol 3,4,5-trisphosphate 3-phosphatase and protein-tyrosine-phosphatase PTEN2A-like [Magnolia sinica]
MPQDFWFSAPRKGIMVFALPGEPGLTELAGDFKVHFHDRQGDFYCWLNTTMVENRKILNTSDLDSFDKRKLPSPGFQVEVVLIDYDGTVPTKVNTETVSKESDRSSGTAAVADGPTTRPSDPSKGSASNDKEDVFSDNEAEEGGSVKSRQAREAAAGRGTTDAGGRPKTEKPKEEMASVTHGVEQVSLRSEGEKENPNTSEMKNEGTSGAASFEVPKSDLSGVSEFKAIAADASVFTFGDEEDYESE